MIAVIADDLTGAAEIAGIGWRHGLRAEILHRNAAPSRSAQLIVYDSDSRNCSAREADRRVTMIARRLKSQRVQWVYKKVDSVLRGNVLAEIAALRRVLGVERCLLLPENPSAGRMIRDGKYFIRGVLIHRTDFRNDPAHPRRTADVRQLLGANASTGLQVRKPIEEIPASGTIVCEATSAEDVRQWATSAGDAALAAGGADFFRALLSQHGLRERKRWDLDVSRRARRQLFVSGSLAASSLDFVERSRGRGWPVLLLPRSTASAQTIGEHWLREIVNAFRQHSTVVVGIGLPKQSGSGASLRLGKILTTTIRKCLSQHAPDLVCVEGGATAALLLERLRWKRLVIEREFAAGVTGVRIVGRGRTLFVLKPGSYAWPESLVSES